MTINPQDATQAAPEPGLLPDAPSEDGARDARVLIADDHAMVSMWAKQYKIDSFRFDLMGHQPRSVMVDLKTKVSTAAGHDVQIIGEGWNFGEVANGARFEQASQLSLNGTGIGTFSDRARDHIRGGGPFDSGADLVKNQGFINGLIYDDNGSGSTYNLKWSGDIIKSGLAGSIRDFSFTTHWDEVKQLHDCCPDNGIWRQLAATWLEH